MYPPSVRSATAGKGTSVLAFVAIFSLLLSLFVAAAPVVAQGGAGEADCPEGTTFLINYNQADIDVGDELVAGVVVTAVTEHEGELASVTVQNNTDGNVTIAVKGGSDQVGNFVTIASGASATISVTDNPTISNLSVCEGPEGDESPTLTVAKLTVGGDSDFQFTLDETNAALLSNGESDEIATAAGDYDLAEVLSEAQVTAGWSVTSIECMGNAAAETASVAAGTVTVTVGADEDVVCTFTNTLDSPPQGAPDIRVEKTPDEDPNAVEDNDVTAGDAATFTITVHNDGDATAEDVMLTDDLPGTGWSIVAAETTLSGCAISGGGVDEMLSCGPDDIAAEGSAWVTVTKTAAYAADCGQMVNTATATPANGDADSDSGEITVKCADIEIEKTPDDASVDAGAEAAFLITVTNNGVGEARGVVVTDVLPAVEMGWTIDPAQTTLVNCSITGDAGSEQTLTCGPTSLGGINAPSNSDTVRVVTTTTINDCGELPNLAEVVTENDGSDEDTGDITVVCEPDEEQGILEIDKFYCVVDDATNTEWLIADPEPLVELELQGVDEGEAPAEGCLPGDATFTIVNNDTDETWTDVSVGEDGILELFLEPGEYTITETSSTEEPAPSAIFTIEADHITLVLVINNEGQEEPRGQIKLVKLFCDADTDSVTFTVEGGDAPIPSLVNCELGDATFTLNDGTPFTIGDDGILFASVPVGEHTLAEVAPYLGSTEFTVVEGEITTIIVTNNEAPNEGEQPGGGGPGQNETPREGTQGGNPLPDTATLPVPNASIAAALLALAMLSGLGAAGLAAVEARRRR